MRVVSLKAQVLTRLASFEQLFELGVRPDFHRGSVSSSPKSDFVIGPSASGRPGVIFTNSEFRDLMVVNLIASHGRGNGSAEPSGTPAVRRRLPDERHSLTHHFSGGGQEGYVTIGLYEDGLPDEIFIRMNKESCLICGVKAKEGSITLVECTGLGRS